MSTDAVTSAAGTAPELPSGKTIAAVLLLAFAIYVGYQWWKARKRGEGDAPGISSPWATKNELKKMEVTIGDHPGRLLIGQRRKSRTKAIATDPQRWMIVQAGPRSGKTAGYVVPNARAWKGPSIIASTKAEIIRLCLMEGDRPYIFYPNISPHSQRIAQQMAPICGWSPTDGIEEALEDSMEEAIWQSMLRAEAMTTGVDMSTIENGDFWIKFARKTLFPLLLAKSLAPHLELKDLLGWAADPNKAKDAITILESPHNIAYTEQPVRNLKTATDKNSRITDGIFGALATALGAYDIPAVLASANVPKERRFRPSWLLDLDDNGQRKCNKLFVLGEPPTPERLGPIYTALIDEVTQAQIKLAAPRLMAGQPPNPANDLLLLLDEAANIVTLPGLQMLTSTGGSQGIVGLIVLQGMSQLVQKYGDKVAATIVANCEAKIYMRGLTEIDTLNYASQIIGQQIVKMPSSRPSGDSGSGEQWSGQQRAIMGPEDIRQMPFRQTVGIYGAERPIRLRSLEQDVLPGKYTGQPPIDITAAAQPRLNVSDYTLAPALHNYGQPSAGIFMTKLPVPSSDTADDLEDLARMWAEETGDPID